MLYLVLQAYFLLYNHKQFTIVDCYCLWPSAGEELLFPFFLPFFSVQTATQLRAYYMISWPWTKLRQHQVSLSSYSLCTSPRRLWCTTLSHIWPFRFSHHVLWRGWADTAQEQRELPVAALSRLFEVKDYSIRAAKTSMLPPACPRVGHNLFTLKSKTGITTMILFSYMWMRKHQNLSRLLKTRCCQRGYSLCSWGLNIFCQAL